MNCSVWKVLDNRGRGWPGAAALQTRTGDAPIAPSSFIAMPLSQLVVRLFANHDRSESGTIETATALLPLPTLATLPISIRERARSIRVAPFDTTAEQHVIHVSFTFAIKQIGIFFIFIYLFFFYFSLYSLFVCLIFHLLGQSNRQDWDFSSLCYFPILLLSSFVLMENIERSRFFFLFFFLFIDIGYCQWAWFFFFFGISVKNGFGFLDFYVLSEE